MKLSPVMSPTGLNFRVQLLILHLTNSRPRQSKLILTPSMPPGGNHRGKTIPLTSLLTHQLQKWSWEGGRETLYHVGRMQHTQDSNTSAWNVCLCPNPSKGHRHRMGGNADTLAKASSPQRATPRRELQPARPAEKRPQAWREEAADCRGRGLPRPGDRSWMEGDGSCPRTRRPRDPRLVPRGPAWGRGGKRGAAASRLRGSSSWREAPRGREGPSPQRPPGPSPGPGPLPRPPPTLQRGCD